jgi:hypothetical protein
MGLAKTRAGPEEAGMTIFGYAAMAAGIYCGVRGAADLRRRRFVWGALGLAIGLFLLFAPLESHAVKLDLPLASADRR